MTAPPLLIDERIIKASDVVGGKYRVERVLGAGGMGIVVAARHVDLRTRFALKIMRPEAAKDPESVERFLREARAAVQLKSEHCVQVADVGKLENGSPYMVMEFLVGHDLGQILERDGARSPAEAADYILQACEGIAEAHARGIVHRDIKPQNLFVTKRPDGRPLVKVLDFGLAKSLGATREMRVLTQTTAVMGSPVYMSPEQMRASREVDARSDLWSLGVCLHELLTGRPPFDGATFPELCSMVLKEPPTPLPSEIPRGLTRIVARCLEKKPERRYPNVGDMAAALEEFAPSVGAAARIRSVLTAPREPLESYHPPRVADLDADTRTAASMDTVRRPAAGRSARWPVITAGVIALLAVAGGIAATRSPFRRSASPSQTATSLPAASALPASPLATARDERPADAPAASVPLAVPAAAAASISVVAVEPASARPATHPRAAPPRRAPVAAPPAQTAASAPLLKPKTTEF